ncbi:MAG: hypothetical protein ACRDPJ_00435 [Nocardioidaceae bacterium]
MFRPGFSGTIRGDLAVRVITYLVGVGLLVRMRMWARRSATGSAPRPPAHETAVAEQTAE